MRFFAVDMPLNVNSKNRKRESNGGGISNVSQDSEQLSRAGVLYTKRVGIFVR